MTKGRFIAVAAVFFVLLAAFIYVFVLYSNVGLNVFFSSEDEMIFNGMYFCDDNKARLYRPLSGSYEDFEKKEIDLSPFGFEGKKFSYFFIDGIMYSENEGLWPVSRENKFVYEEDGKKYVIDIQREKSYPIFSGSQVSLDEYGSKVVAFSANGTFAIEMNGDEVIIYCMTSDPGDFKVDKIKKISLKEIGTGFSFGGFVSETNAYFVSDNGGKKTFAVIDIRNEKAVGTALDEKAEYGEIFGRLFIERFEKNTEKYIVKGWSNILLGDKFYAYIDASKYADAEIISISKDGDYAVISCTKKEGGNDTMVCKNKKSSIIPCENRKITSVFFPANNIIYVNFEENGKNTAESMKICF